MHWWKRNQHLIGAIACFIGAAFNLYLQSVLAATLFAILVLFNFAFYLTGLWNSDGYHYYNGKWHRLEPINKEGE